MAESLFDIFGNHLTRKAVNNVSLQPLTNIENLGKTVSAGPIKPIKPNEPVMPVKKIGESKKSFLSNTGKAIRSTPARQVFTPQSVNVGSMIYSNENSTKESDFNIEELEFTKPKYDYYHSSMFDFLINEPKIAQHISPPSTPPPDTRRHSMELDCSYQDEFFTDDFSQDGLQDDDLGLPDLY